MAQHQSYCSIFANQQLKVTNISLCSCCFRPTATWLSFCCWSTLIKVKVSVFIKRSVTRLQIAFSEQRFQPFPGNSATIVRNPKPSFRNVSIRALFSYDILPVTKVIGKTAIMTWNIEEFGAYYNARLHVNIKIMTCVTTKVGSGSCCSVTIIIKSTFCSVVKFDLEVCVSVNLTYVG